MKHPIHQLLDARLALIEAGIDASSAWFYGDKAPEAEASIREWAANHADVVVVVRCCDGFSVDVRSKFESVVTWYPRYERSDTTTAPIDSTWSDAQHARVM